jgi:hypothetical protein
MTNEVSAVLAFLLFLAGWTLLVCVSAVYVLFKITEDLKP